MEFPAAVVDPVHHAVDDRDLMRIERLLAEEGDVEILHAAEFGRLRVLHVIDDDAIDDRLAFVDFVLAQTAPRCGVLRRPAGPRAGKGRSRGATRFVSSGRNSDDSGER